MTDSPSAEQLPSNELVTYLRDIARGAFSCAPEEIEKCAYWQAADKIDRLTAELAQRNTEIDAQEEELQKLLEHAEDGKKLVEELRLRTLQLEADRDQWKGRSDQLNDELEELEQRPSLCEMEPENESHDLRNGVVCIACWNKAVDPALRASVPPADVLRQGALFARAIEFLEEIRNAAGDEWPVLNEFLDGLPSTKPEHICSTPEFKAGGVICPACRADGVQDHICNDECERQLATEFSDENEPPQPRSKSQQKRLEATRTIENAVCPKCQQPYCMCGLSAETSEQLPPEINAAYLDALYLEIVRAAEMGRSCAELLKRDAVKELRQFSWRRAESEGGDHE